MKIKHKKEFGLYTVASAILIAASDNVVSPLEKDYINGFIERFKYHDLPGFLDDDRETSDFFRRNEGKLSAIVKEYGRKLTFKEIRFALDCSIRMILQDGVIKEEENVIFEHIGELSNLSYRRVKSRLLFAKREMQAFNSCLDYELSNVSDGMKEQKKEELLKLFFSRDDFLKCPKCDDAFLETTNYGKLEVDICCDGCNGIWCDQGELKLLFQRGEKVPLNAGERDIEKEGNITDLTCPRCDKKSMYELDVFYDGSIFVDACIECRGVFFDYREISEMKGLKGKLGF